MSKLDEVLKEVAQKLLGPSAKDKDPMPSWKEILGALPQNPKDRPVVSPVLVKRSGKGSSPETPPENVLDSTPNRPDTGAQIPPHDPHLLYRLRECEKKFQKKVFEAQGLRTQLQKAQKAMQEAQRAAGRALAEVAQLRRDSSRISKERDRLIAELADLQDGSAKLQASQRLLEEEIERLRRHGAELEARLQELEGLADEKEHLEAQLARFRSFKETLPEPFPEEALLRVLVLDYTNLGHNAEERVLALLEAYQALLKGEDHPALCHSNRELLVGEPEGLVLLGLEKLLLDLVNLPIARWLRTHAFRLEAWLQEERRIFSPRVREE